MSKIDTLLAKHEGVLDRVKAFVVDRKTLQLAKQGLTERDKKKFVDTVNSIGLDKFLDLYDDKIIGVLKQQAGYIKKYESWLSDYYKDYDSVSNLAELRDTVEKDPILKFFELDSAHKISDKRYDRAMPMDKVELDLLLKKLKTDPVYLKYKSLVSKLERLDRWNPEPDYKDMLEVGYKGPEEDYYQELYSDDFRDTSLSKYLPKIEKLAKDTLEQLKTLLINQHKSLLNSKFFDLSNKEFQVAINKIKSKSVKSAGEVFDYLNTVDRTSVAFERVLSKNGLLRYTIRSIILAPIIAIGMGLLATLSMGIVTGFQKML